jgi:hypothetical protein
MAWRAVKISGHVLTQVAAGLPLLCLAHFLPILSIAEEPVDVT